MLDKSLTEKNQKNQTTDKKLTPKCNLIYMLDLRILRLHVNPKTCATILNCVREAIKKVN